MRRLTVRFDDETYGALKEEARARGVSLSALVRRYMGERLPRRREPRRRLRVEDFTFIGSSGQRPGDPLYPISENHDEAYVEAVLASLRDKVAKFEAEGFTVLPNPSDLKRNKDHP